MLRAGKGGELVFQFGYLWAQYELAVIHDALHRVIERAAEAPALRLEIDKWDVRRLSHRMFTLALLVCPGLSRHTERLRSDKRGRRRAVLPRGPSNRSCVRGCRPSMRRPVHRR